MKTIGIFYGSTTGNTEGVAKLIGKKLSVSSDDIIEVGSATPEMLQHYDVLILGSSTWGAGDLQDDWEGFVGKLEKMDLGGKQVAVFGTGDSSSYSDTFCDAIATIADAAQKAQAQLIGNQVDASDYNFDESTACVDGMFCGLPIDEDNESRQTEERVSKWVDELKKEIG